MATQLILQNAFLSGIVRDQTLDMLELRHFLTAEHDTLQSYCYMRAQPAITHEYMPIKNP